MPTSRDLEHDGGEFFEETDFPNREEYKQFQLEVIAELEAKKDSEKAKEQEQWMNVNNPYLWESVIDR